MTQKSRFAMELRHARQGVLPLQRAALGILLGAGLAGPAAAQTTTIGSNQTVTNSGASTNQYRFTGDNGRLINGGSITRSSGAPVFAQPSTINLTNINNYFVRNLTLTNSGTITATDSNAAELVAVDGLTMTNSGTLTRTGTANTFPTIFFYNDNNVQFTNQNNGTITSNLGTLNLEKVTNSTFTNAGTISSTSSTNNTIFIGTNTSNLSLSNSGTISGVCSTCSTLLVGGSSATFDMTVGLVLFSNLGTDVVNNFTLTNSGKISATTGAAVSISGHTTGATLTNSGTISATTGIAANITGSAAGVSLTNSGTISATTGTAANIAGSATGVSLTNSGTISRSDPTGGTITNALAVGGNASNVTVTNSGTITGDGVSSALFVGDSATNTTLTNTASGTISGTGANRAITVGGNAVGVSIVNNGLITTTSSAGDYAIRVENNASNVAITNTGTILNNSATSPAIFVTATSTASGSATGAATGVSIANSGTIAANGGVGKGGVAISNTTNTKPIAISNSGIISGDVKLSQAGDKLSVTGGDIFGAITTTTAGNGIVDFNTPGGFTTNGDIGSTSTPLGSITVSGGSVNLGNNWFANSLSLGAGSTTTLTKSVSALATNGVLNFAGGTLALGTNTLTLGANATVRTTGATGSVLQTTIGPSNNGEINVTAGSATIDTTAKTLTVSPSLVGRSVKNGDQYVIFKTSSTTNIANALANIGVNATQTPGITWTVGTGKATDTYGNPLTAGQDIVLIASIPGTSPGVSQAITRSQIQNVVTVITSRVQSISREVAQSRRQEGSQEKRPVYYSGLAFRGLSAGSPDQRWGVWGDDSASYLSNDSKVANFEGYSLVGLGGIDYLHENTWLLGFNAGYVRSDLSVKTSRGQRTANGAVLGPYMSYIINRNFTIDGLFNYTRLANTASSTNGFDSNRYTASANFNAFQDVDRFALTGFAGYSYAVENPSTAISSAAGLPTTVHYGAVKLGGEAAYPMGQFEPYLPLSIAYETTRPRDGTGRVGVTLGVGGRYRVENWIKAGFQVTAETARSHSTNVAAGVNLRVSF